MDRLPQRLKLGLLTLAAINGMGTAYYINYIFFYMEKHFGFDKADNLLLTTFYGFTYTFAVMGYGGLAHRFRHFSLCRTGLLGMTVALVAGGLLPFMLGTGDAAKHTQFVILMVWTISTSLTWPALQASLSRDSAAQLPRTVGIYNVLWAGGGAVAFLTGGVLFEIRGGEALFWTPAILNVAQLIILARLGHFNETAAPFPGAPHPAASPPPDSRVNKKTRAFLRLAWLANPFCYIAMFSFLPIIPQLSQRLGLTVAEAGAVFSVWFWVRLGAFFWFWQWPGWHYRFRWLFTSFVAMIASFLVILLTANLWLLIAAQVVFGLAISLIYYSSLYYSMDLGESKGKRGGIHEAVIGLGIGVGPGLCYGALRLFPGHVYAVAWCTGTVLIIGLLMFLALQVWSSDRKTA